jgi:hypothetical protein
MGREADHSPPHGAEVKNNGAIPLHSPIHHHGMVLNLLNSRTKFLATDPSVPGSIPGATRFSEK